MTSKIFNFPSPGSSSSDDKSPAAPPNNAVDNQPLEPLVEDPVKKAFLHLAAHGRSVAQHTRAVTPDKTRMDSLVEFAHQHMRSLWKPPFEPEGNRKDRLVQEELDQLDQEIQQLRDDEIRQKALCRALELEVPAPERKPQVSVLPIGFALLVFGLAFGGSLLPLFSDIPDQALAWAAAGFIGAAVGGLICSTMFDIEKDSSGE